MARTQGEWEEEGRDAILALLSERLVVPWHEAEARITAGWGGFARVQPVQLNAARQQLVQNDQVVVEHTDHSPPVATIRVPFRKGNKRQIERLRGERRKHYRKYLAWATDEASCGRAGERALVASLHAAASRAGLYVPPQPLGGIDEINGVSLGERGPLDAFAHILNLDSAPIAEVPLVVEVKNVHDWLYPWDRRVWMLLVKAAFLARTTPVVPLLACATSAWQTLQMAKDVGFFVASFGTQLFSPTLIDPEEFEFVRDEFGLNVRQDEDAQDPVVSVLSKLLRASPPPPPPEGEDTPFYRRQASRFAEVAPHILDFEVLAKPLDEHRPETFRAFRARLRDVASWPLGGGW